MSRFVSPADRTPQVLEVLKEEENTPPKKVKEWTQADKDKLTKLMSKIVSIEEKEIAKARMNAAEEGKLRLVIAMSKVRDPITE